MYYVCRPKAEVVVEETHPEKVSVQGADSSAMKYVRFQTRSCSEIYFCCVIW